jgi:hypothetical protein
LRERSRWLDVIGERFESVTGVHPVAVLRYVRGRRHHQAAFAIYVDGEAGAWTWHPWSIVPMADHPGRARPTLESE